MQSKKKIAVFVDWFFPAYKAGGPIVSVVNMITSLLDIYDFYIITSDRDLGDDKPFSNIQLNTWIFEKFYHIIYLSPENQSYKFYSQLFKNVKFDRIYFNSMFSFKFTLLPLLVAKKNIELKNITLAPRGMLSQQAFSKKSFKKRFFLKITQIFNFFYGINFHATNESEKNDINSFFPKNKVIVSPNIPKPVPDSNIHNILKESNTLKLISIARISEEKNTLFALKILSKIKFVNISFDLYGSIFNENYWNECKKVITQLPQNIQVEYKGTIIPSQIPKLLNNYHFSFLPSVGENFGHSIFESMSFGVPVIISNNTPWINLELKKIGWSIPLDKKQKFIEIISYCGQMNQIEYDSMSENAYNYVKNFYINSNFIQQIRQMFEQ